MNRVVVGNVRDGRVVRSTASPPRLARPAAFQAPAVGGGEQIVGYHDGYPVVVRKPRGRFVVDDATGAMKFEHELGPKAQEAMTKVEASLDHLRETVKNLQQPAQKTAMIVAGTITVGLVVAAIVYYVAQKRKQAA